MGTPDMIRLQEPINNHYQPRDFLPQFAPLTDAAGPFREKSARWSHPLRHVVGAVILAALLAGPARPAMGAINQFFFDWDNANTGSGTDFAVMADLNDDPATIAAAKTLLKSSQAEGKPLAVRISAPLSANGPGVQLLNQFPIQYVFLNRSSANAVSQAGTLVSQVRETGASRNAFIGNIGFYPGAAFDPTRNGSVTGDPYTSAGLNMANPLIYPGGADYRTPAAGNSVAPNIRSAMFTLPLERLTIVTNELYGRGSSLSITNNGSATDAAYDASGTKSGLNIPYLTRFNNFGNNALTNSTASGQQFIQNAANPANGQLLSQGDFEALALQARMRGADSVNLFKPSVTDQFGNVYTDTQQQQDLNTGWFATGQSGNVGNVVNGIFATNHYGFANMSNLISIDTDRPNAAPLRFNFETLGVAYSGVYTEAPGNTGATIGAAAYRDKFGAFHAAVAASELAILITNLSDATDTIDLGTIAGHRIFTPVDPNGIGQDDITVAVGTSRLVTFILKAQAGLGLGEIAVQNANGLPVWDETENEQVFTDNNRDGVGTGFSNALPVPEPAGLMYLGTIALTLLPRRR